MPASPPTPPPSPPLSPPPQALRTHIVEIVEPSHLTWLLLGGMALLCLLCDGAGGVGAVAHNIQGWNFGPQEVTFGWFVCMLVFFYLLAGGMLLLRWLATRSVARGLTEIYCATFEEYYLGSVKDDASKAAVEKRPHNERQLLYMLYGFVHTGGDGPLGTDRDADGDGAELVEQSVAPKEPSASEGAEGAEPPPSLASRLAKRFHTFHTTDILRALEVSAPHPSHPTPPTSSAPSR